MLEKTSPAISVEVEFQIITLARGNPVRVAASNQPEIPEVPVIETWDVP